MRRKERYLGATSLALAVLLTLLRVVRPELLPSQNRAVVWAAALLALAGAILIVRSITSGQPGSGPGRD